jgi:hypothetical protein
MKKIITLTVSLIFAFPYFLHLHLRQQTIYKQMEIIKINLL